MLKTGLIALIVGLTASDLLAGTLTNYTNGDVLICFRKNGGANNLVVNAGPVSALISLAPDTRLPISGFTGAQLALVGTNAVSWSAFTWFDGSASPASAQWTLFASKARANLNTKTSPWQAFPQDSQNAVGLDMSSVPRGALDNINFNGLNTSTAVVEPANSGNQNYVTGQSYSTTIDPNGLSDFNFGGDFQGNPENTTPANFTTAGNVVRSDFYQVPASDAGGGPVKFLGYFEFSTNGVMTYVAYPSAAVVAPAIVSIVRNGTTNTVTFTTGANGTYTLCGTNSLGAPRSTWPALTAISGNGGQRSLTDVDAGGAKFYLVKGQ